MPRGGRQPGAGRPKGALSKKTLERRLIEEAVQQRILHHADSLISAQLSLAKGVSYLYRIERNAKSKIKHVLVTDDAEIKEVLDEGGEGLINGKYYYISVKAPDNVAIDSLLNRGVGKPSDKLDLTSKGERITLTDEQFKQAIRATTKRGRRN